MDPAQDSEVGTIKRKGEIDDGQNDVNNQSEIIKRLDQELALSATHRKDIENHWRQVLRKEKFKELHDEIIPLSKFHEQNIERKKEVIKSSQDEFDHLQELYRKAMVTNIFRMNELITVHDNQAILLESKFRERVNLLREEFCNEIERINTKYETEKDRVRQFIRKQQEKDKYMNESIRQYTQHEVEEMKNRNLESINNLRFVLESRVENLEEQLEQTNLEYAQNTDFAKAAYEQLKAKDTEMRKEIQQKTRYADRLQNKIQRFQLITKQEVAENSERHQALLERKARAIQKFQMTKDEMAKFRKDQQQKLILLSRRANMKKEALKQECVMAERVKKIALLCQKMETSREQFASMLRDTVGSNSSQDEGRYISLPQKESAESTANDMKDATNHDMNQLNQQSILLRNNAHRFWDKYNMVQLDVSALEKKVDRLKCKEQDLRRKLQIYQDGITVNDNVLKNRNPLLVINGKMNQVNVKVVNDRKMPRRLTVVDANHIVAITSMAR